MQSSVEAVSSASLHPYGLNLPLRIITHNIRFAKSPPSKNERLWEEREPLIVNELLYHTRHFFYDGNAGQGSSGTGFICLQEVLHSQLVDILSDLNGVHNDQSEDPPRAPFWAYIGVGRDDGQRGGEYSPIIYPVQTFELLHSETIWLSPTPDRPSKGWPACQLELKQAVLEEDMLIELLQDASSIRILTVGVFKHRKTGIHLIAANTHLDDSGSESRKQGILVILNQIDRLQRDYRQYSGVSASGGDKLPLFLAGDFNSKPSGEAYQTVKKCSYMFDIHDLVPRKQRYGDVITFTGFDPEEDKDEQGRIDFVWIDPRTEDGPRDTSTFPWRVDGYAVLPNLFEDGVYSSDHRSVVADLALTEE